MRSPQLRDTGGRAIISTSAYRLEVQSAGNPVDRAPYAALFGADGEFWMDISLLASAHTAAMPDETTAIASIAVTTLDSGDIEVLVTCSGTAWDSRVTRVLCRPDRIEVGVAVTGSGDLTDVILFGGDGTMPNGAAGSFRSAIGFAAVLAPAATEPVQLVRPAGSAAVLGVVGDADPGRLHAVFSPPPLVLGLTRTVPRHATDVPDGQWLGLSLRAPVDELSFTAMRYDPLDDGFRVALDYEGHTRVDGSWRSPTIVIAPATDGWSTLDHYREGLMAIGAAPTPVPTANWWREPIFCGWGAQCARAVHLLHGDANHPTSDTIPETPEEERIVALMAPTLARHDVYDEFLARLHANDLHPGTIVIDDRWQAEYGAATVDVDHWPDLRGWIADRHAAGQKVLLWWKAWDPEGIPVDECVTDAAGRPVSVDPGNAAYLDRLRGIVTHLLSADGLDADGFKVDFTQRGPSGRTLKGTPGVWGIAALHALLAELYSAAKAAKPDALVICHAVHPSFGDTMDMVRLNDVSKFDVYHERVPVADQLGMRFEIARRALPGHLVDTDQWPMPNRDEWLRYVDAQAALGVPALYYLESIDRSGEHIRAEDLDRVAASWAAYRERLAT